MEQLMSSITGRLFALQDVKYGDFNSKMLPGINRERIIGVRTPALKNLAKELAKNPQISDFLHSLPHACCEAGQCEVTFNGQDFVLREGDCMIVIANRLVSQVRPSDGFRMTVIYVDESFLQACTPHSNYGTRGGLSLYINPIMRLTDEERFRTIRARNRAHSVRKTLF